MCKHKLSSIFFFTCSCKSYSLKKYCYCR
uniref:Uncharacterized protein n=1 Tax=Rhizophora mucronata TaxID=61149 RepID=A0A2P2PSU7_RHIMU